MITFGTLCHNPCRYVLNSLKVFDLVLRYTVLQRNAVVDTGRHEEEMSCSVVAYNSNIPQVEVHGFEKTIILCVHGEVTVQYKSKTPV